MVRLKPDPTFGMVVACTLVGSAFRRTDTRSGNKKGRRDSLAPAPDLRVSTRDFRLVTFDCFYWNVYRKLTIIVYTSAVPAVVCSDLVTNWLFTTASLYVAFP